MIRRVTAYLASFVCVAAVVVAAGFVLVKPDVPRARVQVDVAADAVTEGLQPILGDNGRILGWFSLDDAHDDLLMLVPLLALIAIGSLGLAVMSFWQHRRRHDMPTDERAEDDQLTGLPNQYRLRRILDEALSARAEALVISYGYVDLDRFEEVNHALGPQGGDAVLKEVAERLAAALPEGASVGRVGGDCFGIILATSTSEAGVTALEAAARSIARPFRMEQVVTLTATAGIASAPRDGTTRDDLARRAQLALRVAKQRGRGQVTAFTLDMEADVEDRRFIKRELAIALAEHTLDLHYQPIVAAGTSGIIGVEALLRWNHPERGYIPPAEFVKVAEETGLMDRLGQFVLRRALADAAEWPNLYLAVNLSPLQMRDPSLVNVISSLLRETQFTPSRLVLEITEGVLIDNPDEMRRKIEELRALGVRLALDDFGSGYSSLTYLQKLPFDKLKIDRAFVVALSQSENGGVIIQAIVALGRALGMSVLVEGVETEEQRVLLRLAGCNEMQGFLFARPAPREQIGRLLAQAAA